MGVSLKQAKKWEDHYEYKTTAEHGATPGGVNQYFAEARTKNWKERLGDYQAWLAQKQADEANPRHDEWFTYHVHQAGYDESHRDVVTETRFFPYYPSDEYAHRDTAEGKELKAWKRRWTTNLYREMRIGTEFHGFMDLPAELRNIIYGFALVTGRVVVPNDSHKGNQRLLGYWRHPYNDLPYQRYAGLSPKFLRTFLECHVPIGLIQGVSRVVQAEATKVFFNENQFIFPAGPFTHPRFFNGPFAPIAYVGEPEDYTSLARDVSYTFDMRDFEISDFQNRYDHFVTADDDAVTPQQFMQRLHDNKLQCVQIEWAERINAIKSMELDRLQLSFEECYCCVGCCRQVEFVCDLIIDTGPANPQAVTSFPDWRSRPPLLVEIFGWKNEDEKDMIMEKLGRLRELLETIEIRLTGMSKAEVMAAVEANMEEEANN